MEQDFKPSISGPSTLWWFNSQTPGGYPTQITLTTTCTGTSWNWDLISGTSKVSLGSNGSCSLILFSGGASATQNDVRLTVTVNGVTSNIFTVTVRSPQSLSYVTEGTVSNASFGYRSLVEYQIRDQFGTLLPSTVPINELFTTGIVNDFPGTNWIRAPQGGASVSPSGWSDTIDGQPLNGAIPQPTGPCSPLCNVPIHHFDGEWYVGSVTPGNGIRVQTNTWQRYRDHATHTNRISPSP
jgi:hypothetical protein